MKLKDRNSAFSTNHECVRNGPYDYTISWMAAGGRLPGSIEHKARRTSKRVDDIAAERFCKRWKIPFPGEAMRATG